MFFNAIIASAATLAVGANAAAVPVHVQRALHLADYRMYASSDCLSGHLGLASIGDNQLGHCKPVPRADALSVSTANINMNCQLYFYSDVNCTGDKQSAQWKHCYYAPEGVKAWTIECDIF